MSDWVGIVATFAVSVAGIYFANSFRRRSKFELAEARRSAYAALWEITGLAAPTRLNQGRNGLLLPHERQRLIQEMTNWYYAKGQGMLLSKHTRSMYLSAKKNLTCDNSELEPDGSPLVALFPPDFTDDERRGCLSIRQLSLLRTQMKSDLAVYGRVYSKTLRQHERRFVRHCIGPTWRWRKPWRHAARGKPPTEHCSG